MCNSHTASLHTYMAALAIHGCSTGIAGELLMHKLTGQHRLEPPGLVSLHDVLGRQRLAGDCRALRHS